MGRVVVRETQERTRCAYIVMCFSVPVARWFRVYAHWIRSEAASRTGIYEQGIAFLTQEICYVRPNTVDRLGNERDHRGKAGQEQTFCVRKAIPVPAVPAPQQLRDHPNTNSTLLGVVPQLSGPGEVVLSEPSWV